MPVADPGYSEETRNIHGVSNLTERKKQGGIHGPIATQHGFVLVDTAKDRTTLQFAWKGKIFIREFASNYRRPFLATLANRFANEVEKGLVRPRRKAS